MLRPKQWAKNVFVLAPLFFAGRFSEHARLWDTLEVLLGFCLLSSAVYVFNDLRDLESDRVNPLKCNRPIASGKVSPAVAWAACLLLAPAGLLLAWGVSARACLVLACYLALNTGYSLGLKRVAVVDVLCVSAGFILRVLAGGVAAGVPVSQWLLMCVLTLSLLLALGKRRHELLRLGVEAGHMRRVLAGYSVAFLDHALTLAAGLAVLSYLLYLIEGQTTQVFHSQAAFFSSFFVLHGILRYLNLVHTHDQGGDPSEMLFHDRPLLATCLGWVVFWLVVIYLG
jgi:4-hydroxybenzoate polyprenyltransferase